MSTNTSKNSQNSFLNEQSIFQENRINFTEQNLSAHSLKSRSSHDSISCSICGLKFTFFDRKHHCRACFTYVCNLCSKWRFNMETTNTNISNLSKYSGIITLRSKSNSKKLNLRICAACHINVRIRLSGCFTIGQIIAYVNLLVSSWKADINRILTINRVIKRVKEERTLNESFVKTSLSLKTGINVDEDCEMSSSKKSPSEYLQQLNNELKKLRNKGMVFYAIVPQRIDSLSQLFDNLNNSDGDDEDSPKQFRKSREISALLQHCSIRLVGILNTSEVLVSSELFRFSDLNKEKSYGSKENAGKHSFKLNNHISLHVWRHASEIQHISVQKLKMPVSSLRCILIEFNKIEHKNQLKSKKNESNLASSSSSLSSGYSKRGSASTPSLFDKFMDYITPDTLAPQTSSSSTYSNNIHGKHSLSENEFDTSDTHKNGIKPNNDSNSLNDFDDPFFDSLVLFPIDINYANFRTSKTPFQFINDIGKHVEIVKNFNWHRKVYEKCQKIQSNKLASYNKLMAISVDQSIQLHYQKLHQLYSLYLPDLKQEQVLIHEDDIFSVQQPPFKSKNQKLIGFQGNDPITDFRGTGLLGLECLIYFALNHSDQCRIIVQQHRNNKRTYPFCATAINIVSLLTRFADIQNYKSVDQHRNINRLSDFSTGRRILDLMARTSAQEITNSHSKDFEVVKSEKQFFELFCALLRLFDRVQVDSGSNYFDCPQLLQSIYDRLNWYFEQRSPQSMQKLIDQIDSDQSLNDYNKKRFKYLRK